MRKGPVIASLLFLAFVRPAAAEENRIVAIVNNEIITQSELNRALAPVYFQMQASLSPEELSQQMDQLRRRVLEQLVDERLMLQEARSPREVEVGKGKIGTPPVITVSERDVEEMLEETRSRFETPEEFAEALLRQGITEEDLRARFSDQVTIQKLIGREIRSRVIASPAEITAYYEGHPEEFIAPPAVQVATILIRPKDEKDWARAQTQARDLHQQIQGGADFYDLARRYSDGFNAQMGGRIGFLEKGQGRKEIDDALFRLKAGELSPVIRTPAGFHLFLVEATRPARQSELSEVQEEIKYRLLDQKATARYKEWIAKLREDSYISIQLP